MPGQTWYGVPSDTDGDGFLEFSSGKEEITVRWGESPWSKSLQLRVGRQMGGELAIWICISMTPATGRSLQKAVTSQSGESWHNANELVFLPAGMYKVRVVTRTNDLPRWIQLLSMLGSFDPYTESGSMTSPAESANPGYAGGGGSTLAQARYHCVLQ